MIVIDFKKGPNAGQRIGLQKNAVLVGDRGCDVVIVDPQVTGPHCQIEFTPNGYTSTDVGSSSGTRLGSPQAQPLPMYTAVTVTPGTPIFIGETHPEIVPLHGAAGGD